MPPLSASLQSGGGAQSLDSAAAGWASPLVQLWRVPGQGYPPNQRGPPGEERDGERPPQVVRQMAFHPAVVSCSCLSLWKENHQETNQQDGIRREKRREEENAEINEILDLEVL